MKYCVEYKVTCRCCVEVEADCIEDAIDIADEQMFNGDINIRKCIDDFTWEEAGAWQVESLLKPVYGVDKFGNVLYKED